MELVILFIFATSVNANLNGQCRLDPHPSVEYRCIVSGAVEGSRECGVYEPAGTFINPRCRRPTYYSPSPLPYMRCIGGHWDYIAKCIPECGRVTPDAKKLVAGGQDALRGELPWHAGIYSTASVPYMQICGGSLISNNVVLSAAHCFWTDLTKQLPASMFAVAVGKLYRPWNDNMDQAQKSQVKVIHLPIRFQGASANFQDDIAVVIVAQEFQFKTNIRPVCLSFDYIFEQQQLHSGNKGKVAGWGLTAANGKESPVLQVVDLPYVDVGTCIYNSPPDYREYITSDKICAGTLEPNSALCRGDSGGGLAFSESIAGIERYYLRGVVSTAPTSNDACNTATYTSFTSIRKHEQFIKQFWIESGEFKCEDGGFITAAKFCDGTKDCADGTDETFDACAKLTCSHYLFRCKYGACIDKGATCNKVSDCADSSDEAPELCEGSATTVTAITSTHRSSPKPQLKIIERCVLPPYPEHGWYDSNIAGAEPGQAFERVTLTNITCQRGYTAQGISEEFSCSNGVWNSLPKCISICRGPAASTDHDEEGGKSEYEFFDQVEHCYKFHTQAGNWSDANRTCVAEGARLAVANSLYEEAVLASLLDRHPEEAIHGTEYKLGALVGIFWESGVWMTVDGQTLADAGRANWAPGEPSKEDSNPYVVMLRDRTIHNGSNYHKFAFICERTPAVPAPRAPVAAPSAVKSVTTKKVVYTNTYSGEMPGNSSTWDLFNTHFDTSLDSDTIRTPSTSSAWDLFNNHFNSSSLDPSLQNKIRNFFS